MAAEFKNIEKAKVGITINIGKQSKKPKIDTNPINQNPRAFQPTKVYIGGISQKYDEAELKELCKSYGRILSFFYMEDCSGSDMGWILVTYECIADANTAITGFKVSNRFETRLSTSQNYSAGRREWKLKDEDKIKKEDSDEELPSIIAMTNAQKNARENATAANLSVAQLQAKEAEKNKSKKVDNIPKWESWREYQTKDGHKYYYNVSTNQTTWEKPENSIFKTDAQLAAAAQEFLAQQEKNKISLPPGAGPIGTAVGAPGCNLFVYHIPIYWTEQDFLQHFATFGTVIHIRINRDDSGISRGYGFCSYDNPQSAIQAIHAMNGYEIEGKRLNVSIKKGEESTLMNNAVAAP